MVPSNVASGSRGRSVRSMQDRLKALGYVIGQYGVNDGRTQRAILAFRKLAGMARTSSADPAFFRALISGKGGFKVRYPRHGRHVEGDLAHQVLALIDAGGKVERIYPMSSGRPRRRRCSGTFRVYRKTRARTPRAWSHSTYFIRGYAIHGYVERADVQREPRLHAGADPRRLPHLRLDPDRATTSTLP